MVGFWQATRRASARAMNDPLLAGIVKAATREVLGRGMTKTLPNLPIQITDTTLRDGIQSLGIGKLLSPKEKAEYVRKVTNDSPSLKVECGSLIPSGSLPQMDNSESTLVLLARQFPASIPNTVTLLANPKSAERYLALPPECRSNRVSVVAAGCPDFSRENLNKTPGETFKAAHETVMMLKGEEGLMVTAYVSQAAVGINGEPLDHCKVVTEALPLVEAGCRVALVDTKGDATLKQFLDLQAAALAAGIPVDKLVAHVHGSNLNTLTIAAALFLLGVKHWDVTLIGLGGCGHALGEDKQANLNMRDLIGLCEVLGIDVPVDIVNLAIWEDEISTALGIRGNRPITEVYANYDPDGDRTASPYGPGFKW